jgi:thiamine pyrophosphate-dependent acetolactate synthase large subunit-like protein
MANTKADWIVVVLVASGAERVYGFVVDSLNSLTDATHRQGKNRVSPWPAD